MSKEHVYKDSLQVIFLSVGKNNYRKEKVMQTKKLEKKFFAVLLTLSMIISSGVFTGQAKAATDLLPTATNLTFDSARAIVFDSANSEELSSSSSKRYYKFTLDAASEVVIHGEISKARNVSFNIYDESRSLVWSEKDFNGFTFSAILTGGQYYLELDGEVPIQFTVSKNDLLESFTETQTQNNDMIDNASEIEIKENYKGILAENDSIDYFKFNVSAKGKISFSGKNNVSRTIQYIFYDSNKNSVYTIELRAGDKSAQTFTIEAGDYYLAVIQKEVGSGTGSYTFALDYTVVQDSAPVLTSVKNMSGKKMKISWRKARGVAGYELMYARSSNFKSGLVKKKISSASSSVTYRKLKKGKKYYVKLRSYKVVDGKTIYSKWSGKKSVKIKK